MHIAAEPALLHFPGSELGVPRLLHVCAGQ